MNIIVIFEHILKTELKYKYLKLKLETQIEILEINLEFLNGHSLSESPIIMTEESYNNCVDYLVNRQRFEDLVKIRDNKSKLLDGSNKVESFNDLELKKGMKKVSNFWTFTNLN